MGRTSSMCRPDSSSPVCGGRENRPSMRYQKSQRTTRHCGTSRQAGRLFLSSHPASAQQSFFDAIIARDTGIRPDQPSPSYRSHHTTMPCRSRPRRPRTRNIDRQICVWAEGKGGEGGLGKYIGGGR
ncbi:hypothetical protein KVR01_001669 [Diaporthe batatas]|uniref:uncharacterized protein n=1 Tax=Diaporthe batatas TaxID=748121 RepID=UPI001D04806B|nr:uncharacterized protein KVR01_001669 [Diaporthe batatas]KAG8168920.1 hypothetical protein KVR01_001669 [Diaporthe batatas]